MHLMFECEVYSERIWKGLSDGINEVLCVRLHAYNVMYNNDMGSLNASQNDQILYLIQEIKRNFIYRIYIGSTIEVLT